MTKHFYAAHNSHADIQNGSRGFANTWEISRFSSAANRNAFVAKHENKNARALTRNEAVRLFADNYRSVGENVPVGGLFGADKFGETNFWNELFREDA